MQIVKQLGLISVLLLGVCGCSPCRHIESSTRDSIVVEIRPRPITIRDTIYVEIPREVERKVVQTDTSHLSNTYAKSEAIILPNGSLKHTLESIPQQIAKPTEQKILVRDSIIYRDKRVTERIEIERELTEWQLLQLRGFWILLILIALYVKLKNLTQPIYFTPHDRER